MSRSPVIEARINGESSPKFADLDAVSYGAYYIVFRSVEVGPTPQLETEAIDLGCRSVEPRSGQSHPRNYLVPFAGRVHCRQSSTNSQTPRSGTQQHLLSFVPYPQSARAVHHSSQHGCACDKICPRVGLPPDTLLSLSSPLPNRQVSCTIFDRRPPRYRGKRWDDRGQRLSRLTRSDHALQWLDELSEGIAFARRASRYSYAPTSSEFPR